jgi:hypothetical protein
MYQFQILAIVSTGNIFTNAFLHVIGSAGYYGIKMLLNAHAMNMQMSGKFS